MFVYVCACVSVSSFMCVRECFVRYVCVGRGEVEGLRQCDGAVACVLVCAELQYSFLNVLV